VEVFGLTALERSFIFRTEQQNATATLVPMKHPPRVSIVSPSSALSTGVSAQDQQGISLADEPGL
jgi:hypothetical protein